MQNLIGMPTYEELLVKNQFLLDDNVRFLQQSVVDGERIASLEGDIRSLKLCLCQGQPSR